MNSRFSFAAAALLLAGLLSVPSARAQGPKLETAVVTDNFAAAVVIHPQRLLKSPTVKALGAQVEEALAGVKKQTSVDPHAVSRFVVLIGPKEEGANPGGPPFEMAIFMYLEKPLDVETFLEAVDKDGEREERTYKGEKFYKKADPGDDDVIFHVSADRKRLTAVMSEARLKQVLDRAGKGALADRAAKAELDHDAVIVFVTGPIQKAVEDFKERSGGEVPAAFAGLFNLPSLIKTGEAHLDATGDTLMALSLDAKDEEAADQVNTMINGLVGLGKLAYVTQKDNIREQVGRQLERQDLGIDIDDYMKMVDGFVNGIAVKKSGQTVKLTVPKPEGFDKVIKQLATRGAGEKSEEKE